ncbi:MAG TPA: DUF502 domain-containing protein [Nevskiaceae bacterium]|nr:DUF502 domain-containing protein [Nevskiaceae bacterium]
MSGTLLRRWVVAGLLVWIPLGVTLFVLSFLVRVLDASQVLIPQTWRFPGLGIFLSALLVLGTGALTANLIGKRIFSWFELVLQRVPLLGSVYAGMKKLAETLFSSTGASFRRVLLIEYPRKGMWTLAFQTGATAAELGHKTGRELLTVFVPTTPNPTSGFVILVPSDEAIVLDMPVEDGLRLVISLGVVTPEAGAKKKEEIAPFGKLG